MYTRPNEYTIELRVLNDTKLLFNRAGSARVLSLLFPFTRVRRG